MGGGGAPFGAPRGRSGRATSLSQEALAERAGLSRRGISDLERGARRAPYLTTVQRLAEAMALTPSDRLELIHIARQGHKTPSGDPIADTEWSSLLQIHYARRSDGA